MATKKYVLTIQYDDNGDNCEYIQEEIVDDTPETKRIVYEANVQDYFDKPSLAMLLDDEIAEA